MTKGIGDDLVRDFIQQKAVCQCTAVKVHPPLAAVLPYCDEAVFFDNDNGFVEIANYRNGEITIRPNAASWIKTLLSEITI